MQGCILSARRHVPAAAGQTDAWPGGEIRSAPRVCLHLDRVVGAGAEAPRLQEQERERPDPGASAAEAQASGGSSAFSVNDLNFLMAQTYVWGDWVGGEGGVQRLQMVPPGSEVSAPPRARGGGTEVPGHPGAEAYAAGGARQDLRSGGLALAGLVAYLPPSVSQHRRPELPLAGSPRRVSHPALSLEVAQCWQL